MFFWLLVSLNIALFLIGFWVFLFCDLLVFIIYLFFCCADCLFSYWFLILKYIFDANISHRWLQISFSSLWLFLKLKKNVYLAVLGFSLGMQTLSCSMWDLDPWLRIKPGPPALGAQSFSDWTTRDVPLLKLKKKKKYLLVH